VVRNSGHNDASDPRQENSLTTAPESVKK
jgi:hypothetical protein